MRVTAEQVRDAALTAGITSVESHPCSFCGVVVGYRIRDGELYFDSGCECCYNPNSLQPRDWQNAADWINMQTHDEQARHVATAFGLNLNPLPPTV
jgi:hypothetical protein